ncbi:nucleotide exchange factor GrpE [Candidatus Bathyarchaeota archaeon]|nr:nucleotide exchange factor GrpE [Candidatus Bathyarchaeota archaeon]
MTPDKKQSKKELEQKVKELEEKAEKLEAELHETAKQSEKYLNQLKYAKADLENMQKQHQRRLAEVIEKANGELLEKLLPFIDELEILHSKDADKEKLLEGVKMVHDKLLKLVESEGVKQIKGVGEKFDPFKHDAIVEVETLDVPDGCIAEEIRRGYMFRDKVLRASVVKVARAPDVVEIEIEDNQDE